MWHTVEGGFAVGFLSSFFLRVELLAVSLDRVVLQLAAKVVAFGFGVNVVVRTCDVAILFLG